MPPYFDVRTLAPGTPDSIATRSINLMCAILKGIPYRELYDRPFHDGSGNSPLDRIIHNINNLHRDLQRGATTNSAIVIPILAGSNGAFVRIRAVLGLPGMPAISLGDLFHQRRQHPTTDIALTLKNFVVDTLESVHSDTNDQMYHFCVPFIATQIPGRRPTRPTKAVYRRFIAKLGHMTLQDFYDQPYEPEHRTAAIAARQAGIFKERRPQSSRPPGKKTTGGNGKHCVDGTCCGSNDPEDWCNTVGTGSDTMCSLGSDYGTQCYEDVKKKPAVKKPAPKKPVKRKPGPRK